MEPVFRVVVRLDRGPERVRIVLTTPSGDELLRGSLPPPELWSGNPLTAMLESLALWLDTQLRVVFSADVPSDGYLLGLTDEAGTGLRTVLYEVAVAPRGRRRRPVRLRGVGDFQDVHQLRLDDCLTGGAR